LKLLPPILLHGWIKKYVEAAIRAKDIADRYGITLPELAHRFLLSLPHPFNIVIGASNRVQLMDTIKDFNNGPLPDALVLEIINNTNKM
jgi:D-threo-aldose 1-dehydrogenase